MTAYEEVLATLTKDYRVKSILPDDLGTLLTLSHNGTGINVQLIVLDNDWEDGDE